jgi:Tfp pilus assembly major pilin PilA
MGKKLIHIGIAIFIVAISTLGYLQYQEYTNEPKSGR